MKNILKKLKGNKGTETIEFVILFPIVIFLIFGSMTFMLAIYSKIVVVDAAREAARAEAVGAATAQEKAKEVIKGFGLKEELIDSVTSNTTTENGVEYITTEVVYKQPSMFPLLPKLIKADNWPDYFILSSQAVFKKEKL